MKAKALNKCKDHGDKEKGQTGDYVNHFQAFSISFFHAIFMVRHLIVMTGLKQTLFEKELQCSGGHLASKLPHDVHVRYGTHGRLNFAAQLFRSVALYLVPFSVCIDSIPIRKCNIPIECICSGREGVKSITCTDTGLGEVIRRDEEITTR